MVCMEDLQVRNMLRSAAGSAGAPSRNVRAKSALSRSILDQGWFEFRRQLEYKLAWNGGLLILVPPHHSSRECPVCGHTEAGNRRTQARFCCLECGYSEHADRVGAINVLAGAPRGSLWIDFARSRGVGPGTRRSESGERSCGAPAP